MVSQDVPATNADLHPSPSFGALGSTLSILTVSTLYPNQVQPTHGIFVETRLRKLLTEANVKAQVMAPVPWLPRHLSFVSQEPLWSVPRRTERHGIVISHPRYLVIPKLGMNLTPFTLYRAMHAELRRLLSEGLTVDLIDAHYFYPDGVAAVWLARAFNFPVVVTARGTDINLIPNYQLPRRLILAAAAKADGIVAVCQALKERLVELGVEERRIRVLRNGVDLDRFTPRDRLSLRRKMGLDGFTIASIGHLIERKGHHHVIRALVDMPDATLLIAGDGPEYAALQALAANLGVSERVRFLGVLDQTDVCDVYNCADVLVLASSREGWANVLLEAMACGTPVVASAVWGTPEVVARPEAGVLMSSVDSNGVLAGVRAIRSLPPDRACTRLYAEGFDWRSTTEGQVELFSEILARRVSRQPKTVR
jgi:glycosyltransferase involved in cell wall biosynthesis